jgi:hypothetical protein
MPRYKSSFTLRRLPRSSAFRFVILLFFIWDSLYAVSVYLQYHAVLKAPPPHSNTKRIFIAAQHWNSAHVLRSHWNAALCALVQELGIENVFVSIYESGSFDATKAALRELDATLEDLQVKKSIMLSDISHADEITKQSTDHGWITTPEGKTELRRIPFLASIRNRVFEPLEALTAQGEHFDTILFLNDVVFTPQDVLRLLDTNGGDYAAACSLDFSHPPAFYDTFALRDSGGHAAVMQTWPYFRSRASRYAMERGLPVPVTSCWNGMGMFSPSPISHREYLQRTNKSQSPCPFPPSSRPPLSASAVSQTRLQHPISKLPNAVSSTPTILYQHPNPSFSIPSSK